MTRAWKEERSQSDKNDKGKRRKINKKIYKQKNLWSLSKKTTSIKHYKFFCLNMLVVF